MSSAPVEPTMIVSENPADKRKGEEEKFEVVPIPIPNDDDVELSAEKVVKKKPTVLRRTAMVATLGIFPYPTAMVSSELQRGYVPGIPIVDIRSSPYLRGIVDTACNSSVFSVSYAEKAAKRLKHLGTPFQLGMFW